MNGIELLITEKTVGQRLDRVLRDAVPELSRAALQKAVLAGLCLVDGLVMTRPAARTRSGQRVSLRLPAARKTLTAEQSRVEILWQDEHLLVCNKPAGLTVHPCPSCPDNTLVQRLLGRFPQLAQLGGSRPGIVHRLDKDTSGLLLAALDEPTRLAMSDAFARRKVHKEYLAIVSGMPSSGGQCLEPLGRHPTIRIKMSVLPQAQGGKPAQTTWKRLWSAPDQSVSLLAVCIHTGRTHQIRVHLSHLEHPLLGDALYAPKNVRTRASRQMLHAWRLSFTHPQTDKEMRFVCPLPEDMIQTALAACRRMQRIVVVGNPGSGKSTFVRYLANTGIPVISADAIVADLYASGGEVADWVRQRCGNLQLTAGSAVDKAALFAAMRTDTVLRRDIEQMVHGLVRVALDAFWEKQENAGFFAAVAELPLYFECGWQGAFSPAPLTIGVHCPMAQRMHRTMTERGWSEDKAAVLESWQWPEACKEAICDMLVDNSGSLGEMALSAERTLQDIERRRTAMEQQQRRLLEDACR
ncbi:MAG: dephospho-CoA kinase [Desulfovibrio sp.]|nr:dephospho-CoA kinase [Desulfovibrio sp.]